MDVLVPACVQAERILELGASRVMALAASRGAGDLPDPERVPQLERHQGVQAGVAQRLRRVDLGGRTKTQDPRRLAADHREHRLFTLGARQLGELSGQLARGLGHGRRRLPPGHQGVEHGGHGARRSIAQGTPIEAGQKVAVYHLAANRDPQVFPEPHRFDITRSPNDHVSFGFGPHFCIGSHLARLQMRSMVGELVSRLGVLALDGDPVRLQSNFQQGLKSLPVR